MSTFSSLSTNQANLYLFLLFAFAFPIKSSFCNNSKPVFHEGFMAFVPHAVQMSPKTLFYRAMG